MEHCKSTFLKECMADALIERMRVKDFSKVTINEIAETAGVNRSTWFRNFADKQEALTYKLTCLWNRWVQSHKVREWEHYTVENARDFFEFNYENRGLIRLMVSADQYTAIYQAFYAIMKPQFEADPAERYRSRFYSYGMFGLLGEWCSGGFRHTPAEMTRMFFEMIGKNAEESE